MNRSILFALFIWTSCAHAQQADKSSRNIIIQNDDVMIEASALVGESKVNISDELTYHWFRNNEIHQTKGGFDGDIMHGDYTSFYPGKELKEKGSFNKGVKTGMWKSWHENGEVKEIVTWRNGMQNGAYMKYSSTGVLLLQSTFKNGLLHGKMVSYQDGKILNKSYYENGKEIKKAEEPADEKKKKKKKKRKASKKKKKPAAIPPPTEEKKEPEVPEKS
ncbi:MAG TPA: hypothetical protein EYN69_06350 [Flavobacteriales bacterium]|nr:hypothetical protein [Flavobacteriales bacterium]